MIDVVAGIPQALAAIGERVGLPRFGSLTAALVALGSIGGLSAWVSGTARLPFVVGVDRYLPQALARVHPKHGTPHVALLVQGVMTSLVLLAAISGASIHEAFVILVDMTIVTSLLPLLYIMAALPILRRRRRRTTMSWSWWHRRLLFGHADRNCDHDACHRYLDDSACRQSEPGPVLVKGCWWFGLASWCWAGVLSARATTAASRVAVNGGYETKRGLQSEAGVPDRTLANVRFGSNSVIGAHV